MGLWPIEVFLVNKTKSSPSVFITYWTIRKRSQERVWKFQLICFAHRVIWRNLQHRASSGTTFDFVNDQLLKFTRWMCIHKEERKRRDSFGFSLWFTSLPFFPSLFFILLMFSRSKMFFFSSQKVKFEDFACHNSLLQLLMHLLLLLQEVQLSFNTTGSTLLLLELCYTCLKCCIFLIFHKYLTT